MKTTSINKLYGSIGLGCLLALTGSSQTVIDNFEYADNTDLSAQWATDLGTISTSANVAADASGTKSMQLTAEFAGDWATAALTKIPLAAPMTVGQNQYITIRLAGDPEFTKGSDRLFYVYAYDAAGNFGRWGTAMPTKQDWQIFNFPAKNIQAPWNSPGLPDLANITQFKIFVYGQGSPAGTTFTGTVYFDELTVRDTPLLPPPPPTGEKMLADYEYASDADLLADWRSDMGTIALSSYVSPNSKGTNSLQAVRSFSGAPWQTEVVTGPVLAAPVAIKSSQYITLRIAGDPQYTNSTWPILYIYAYDSLGNFGRWQLGVPTKTNWQVFNMQASTIAKPWDSPALPDLTNIVQFKYFLYAYNETGGTAFDTTIYLDELMVRDSPLAENPAPSTMRDLIDNFESYADNNALLGFYGYINSPPATTTTTASLESPAPQGSKALRLAIDFSSGRYPWGSIRSQVVAPFSFPTNAVVQCKFKGDPNLAPQADADSTFWISFYDEAGNSLNYIAPTELTTNGNWTTIKAPFSEFWTTATPDTGNLVRWRILVQGWNGTDATPGMTGTFYVDDLQITLPPVLSVARDGGGLKLQMNNLISGKTYTIWSSPDLGQWTSAGTIQATSSSATWTIPAGQKAFYRVSY